MTTSRDAGDDLLAILGDLDSLISSARTMPMSASAIVNRQEALDLIERARRSVPNAVRRADKIVAEADQVLARGREESERLIERAHEEAERLVASENVVRQANDRADAIIAAAEEQAERLRHGADDYSDRTLAALEIEIDKIASQIRSGREVLAHRLEAYDQAEHGEQGDDAAELSHHNEQAAGRSERSVTGSRGFSGWSVDPAAQH